MAKRFTDTNKWDKESFSMLPSKMKLVWIFLCDRCDHAGIWDVNLRLLSFFIGEKVHESDLKKYFGDKIQWLSESKVFLPSFVDFQYGNLNPENKVHLSVINRIEKVGATKDLASPLQGAKDKDKEKEKDKDKDKDKEIEKDKEKEKSEKNEKPSLADLETLYQSYPLKKGKSEGLSRLTKEIKTWDQYSDLGRAIDAYKADLARNKTEAKFIKHFSTFVSSWRDWLEPVESQDFSKPKFEQVEIDQETRDLWEGKWE